MTKKETTRQFKLVWFAITLLGCSIIIHGVAHLITPVSPETPPVTSVYEEFDMCTLDVVSCD